MSTTGTNSPKNKYGSTEHGIKYRYQNEYKNYKIEIDNACGRNIIDILDYQFLQNGKITTEDRKNIRAQIGSIHQSPNLIESAIDATILSKVNADKNGDFYKMIADNSGLGLYDAVVISQIFLNPDKYEDILQNTLMMAKLSVNEDDPTIATISAAKKVNASTELIDAIANKFEIDSSLRRHKTEYLVGAEIKRLFVVEYSRFISGNNPTSTTMANPQFVKIVLDHIPSFKIIRAGIFNKKICFNDEPRATSILQIISNSEEVNIARQFKKPAPNMFGPSITLSEHEMDGLKKIFNFVKAVR